GRSSSRTSTELRPVSINMVDLREMSPGDLLRADSECIRQERSLLRAGGVLAARNRLDHPPVEPGQLNQVLQGDAQLPHPLCEHFHLRHAAPLRRIGERPPPRKL